MAKKMGRNDPCPCGSGLKYKKCCLGKSKIQHLSVKKMYAQKYNIRLKEKQDMSVCKEVIFRLMRDNLYNKQLSQHTKDPKSQLQEFLQSKRLPLPVYEIKKINGLEHAQTFFVHCRALDHCAEGSGSSRRRAEQKAAENLLRLISNHEP